MNKNVEIYRAAGEVAAWPANYGLWCWGKEVVCIFSQGFMGAQEDLHARDMTRPFVGRQARSLDGGLTWKPEPFAGRIPGGTTLSGDEHVVPALQSQPNMDAERDLAVLDEPVDFLDPETIVMTARTGLLEGSVSWFYVSKDRARTWDGPYRLGDFGQKGVSARTDIVPLGRHDAIFMLTAVKSDGTEGRVFCARTRDGGRTFSLESFVGDEPKGFSIMPATVRLDDGDILTVLRCSSDGTGADRKSWLEQYRSSDIGKTWQFEGKVVENTGFGGNPPTLTRFEGDRLVLAYGFRDQPYGIRVRKSTDGGRTWSPDVILRDDGGMPDLGYPRTVALGPDTALTVYYFNDGPGSERYIAGTIYAV